MIRKLSSLLLFSAFIFLYSCNSHDYSETFDYQPSEPSPGDEVTVYYNPSGTELESVENIDMVAYLYSVDLDDAAGVEMKKDGQGFTGTFTTLPGTRGVIVKFVNREDYEEADNNNKEGYRVLLYNENGELVKGTEEGLAVAYYSWGRNAGLEVDRERSLESFNKTFALNTDVKDQYLDTYFNLLFRIQPEEADSLVQKELTALEQKDNLSEEDLSILAKWYRKLEMKDKADKYTTMVIDKYPESKFAQEHLFNLFDEAEDVVNKVERLKKFEQQFPNSEITSDMYDEVMLTYRRNGNYDAALTFIKENPGKVHPYYIYYTAKKMVDENTDKELTKKVAEEGVQQAKTDLENPSRPKPKEATVKEWDMMRSYYLGMNQYIYGKMLNETGSPEKALDILADAVKNTDKYYNVQDLKDYYGHTLIENGKYEQAMNIISGYIKNGNGTPALKEDLKAAYEKVNGNTEGFDEYITEFESAAKEDLLSELKSKMTNDPAPSFTLTDLNGNQVSLADYKGKTVVVDFWATWCGPCLRSFPAMEKAVESYKDNDNVKFIFINAWENADDKKTNAVNFIKENNYPFHVLLDLNNEVITKFKVEGIPTKFIIGPDQDIKFKSVGFSGNSEQMVNEIKMMIDLINNPS